MDSVSSGESPFSPRAIAADRTKAKRQILKWYRDGVPFRQIAKKLNECRFKPFGKSAKWNWESVRSFVRRQASLKDKWRHDWAKLRMKKDFRSFYTFNGERLCRRSSGGDKVYWRSGQYSVSDRILWNAIRRVLEFPMEFPLEKCLEVIDEVRMVSTACISSPRDEVMYMADLLKLETSKELEELTRYWEKLITDWEELGDASRNTVVESKRPITLTIDWEEIASEFAVPAVLGVETGMIELLDKLGKRSPEWEAAFVKVASANSGVVHIGQRWKELDLLGHRFQALIQRLPRGQRLESPRIWLEVIVDWIAYTNHVPGRWQRNPEVEQRISEKWEEYRKITGQEENDLLRGEDYLDRSVSFMIPLKPRQRSKK